MVLHFNVTGESRKAMVKAIEQELGCKAKYLGVPSCAYEIGCYTVGKNGELEFGDFDDIDEITKFRFYLLTDATASLLTFYHGRFYFSIVFEIKTAF